jgi:hypothetical protein
MSFNNFENLYGFLTKKKRIIKNQFFEFELGNQTVQLE